MPAKATTKKPDWFQVRNEGTSTPEVLIYGFIGDWWDENDAVSFSKAWKALGTPTEAVVRIHSSGGYVNDGLAIYNIIRNSPFKVITQVDGVAHSMASVIAMAGDERRASKDVLIMIHNAWGGTYGNASEMRKAADDLDIHNDVLVGIYVERTGKDEAEVRAMMDAETYMTGTMAHELGFVTELMAEQQLAACGDRGAVAHLRTLTHNTQLQHHLSASGLLPDAQPPRTTPMPDEIKAKKQNPPAKPETLNQDDFAAVQQADPQATAADAVRAERERVSGIDTAFAALSGDFEHLRRDAVAKGDTVAEVQARIEFLQAGQKAAPAGGDPVTVSADARDKFKAGALNHLMAQAGLEKPDPQNNLRGYTLAELARESLAQANARPSGSRMEIVASAFTHTSSDFPYLLQECAKRSVLKGFDETEETFEAWTQKGSMSDFRPHDRVGTTGFGALAKINEGGEYTHFSMDEYKESNQLATYGKMFSITRQAIINDDLRAFTTVPQKMGRAARRTIGDLVYALLQANPNMGDGIALFHATHKNLNATAAQITTAAVQAIRTKMAKQKGRDKNVTALNIRPNYVLCPVEMEGTAKVVASAEKVIGGEAGDLTPNSVRGTFEVISDARLDASFWYMLATMYDTIEVAYLDGVETPFLEQQKGWNIDGTEFKVRMDAGVAPLEFASMFKQAAG